MKLKINLFIILIIAIACTATVDARRKTSRRHKTHHSSRNKHSSSSHHKEDGHHTAGHAHHSSSSKHQTLDTQTNNVAAPHADASPNNHQPHPPANTQHQNTQSSEDFADGFALGYGAARRSLRRRRKTTVAPSTTTTSTTTTNPCANDGPMTSDQKQPQANSEINCEASTTHTPLAELRQPETVIENFVLNANSAAT